ncbi:MAG TPA: hypothetical protein PKL15_18020, partial [Saprospiraceae bacterium]|nr:hypothetical protein [Saprospiraceae bacterium]
TNVTLRKFRIDALSVTNNTPVVTSQTGTGVRVSSSQIVKVIGCEMSEGIQNGIVTNRFEIRLEYKQNRISAANYGIYASTTFQMPNLDIFINENIITANTGIQVQNIPYLNDYYRTMEVNENIINPAVYGIYIANTGTDNEIYQNDIGLASEAGASGIVCDMVQGVGFTTHNTINWWPPQYSGGYGIHYSNTHDFHISENTIAATAPPYPYIECGIGLDNNYWGVICCNTVDYTSRGMYLTGANDPFISIVTNIFGNHKVGLEFAPNAVMTPQINPGNDWTAAACAIDAQYPGNASQAQSNAFYRTDPANVPAMQIVPPGWFFFTGTDPSCSDPGYECNIIGATGEPGGLGESLLRGLDTAYAPGYEGARLMLLQALYRHLSEHPELIDDSPAVEAFYNDASAGFIGAWYAAEQARIALGQPAAAQETAAAELGAALLSAQQTLDSPAWLDFAPAGGIESGPPLGLAFMDNREEIKPGLRTED